MTYAATVRMASGKTHRKEDGPGLATQHPIGMKAFEFEPYLQKGSPATTAAARDAAYRRLAIHVLRLDVATLASELEAARRVRREDPYSHSDLGLAA
jgi:hypothetical protein